MYVYAELDGAGLVKAVSSLSGEVTKDTMIPIEKLDPVLMGKRYVKETGIFEEVAKPALPPVYGMEDLKKDMATIKGDIAIIKAK